MPYSIIETKPYARIRTCDYYKITLGNLEIKDITEEALKGKPSGIIIRANRSKAKS